MSSEIFIVIAEYEDDQFMHALKIGIELDSDETGNLEGTMSNASSLWNQHAEDLKSFRFDLGDMLDITFAKDFPHERARQWVSEHFFLFEQLSIAYFFLVFSIRWFMKDRKPFDLQLPLAAWNLFLAVFSTVGSYYLISELINVTSKGFTASLCDRAELYTGPSARWMWLFTLSKPAEFVDTFFIVLRKKPLVFLHWYHHIFTCVYMAYGFPTRMANFRWGIAMNYAVHSAMYSYYFLRAMNIKVPGKVAKAITTAQILQFVISCFILAMTGVEHYVWENKDCVFHVGAFWLAFLMDATYLVLFANFFIQSYVIRGGKAKYSEVTKKPIKSE